MWRDRITIELGDIAQCDTEAVVNAANSELWMGSGVAGAIKRAGGLRIEQEAVRQGPVNVGNSVLTTGGNLPALYVIHAATMAPGRPASAESVRAATASALSLAAENNIESIGLPALGTGVGGLSLTSCAREMLEAARNHCLGSDRPQEIHFVLFGQNARDAFNTALEATE